MDPSEQKIHTIGVFQNFQGYGGKFTRTATFYDGQLSGTVFTNALGLRGVQEPETLHPCIYFPPSHTCHRLTLFAMFIAPES